MSDKIFSLWFFEQLRLELVALSFNRVQSQNPVPTDRNSVLISRTHLDLKHVVTHKCLCQYFHLVQVDLYNLGPLLESNQTMDRVDVTGTRNYLNCRGLDM